MHNTKWVRIVYSEQARYCWNKIAKTKLSCYVHTYQAERNIKLILFKIMILHDEYLEDLLVLLGDNNSLATSSHASVLDLPTNDDLQSFWTV